MMGVFSDAYENLTIRKALLFIDDIRQHSFYRGGGGVSLGLVQFEIRG